MKRPDDKIIKKVFEGRATKEESAEVIQWFSTEEGSIYLSKDMNEFAESIIPGLEDRYLSHAVPSQNIFSKINREIRFYEVKKIVFKIAAVLIPLIFLIGGYFYLHPVFGDVEGIEYEEVYAPKGERMQIVFQDGTHVYLNADSYLKYPKTFATDKRQVSLRGEGYFVVAKNVDVPFEIDVYGNTIDVLGTSFNVLAYPESEDIVVALDEGKVTLETQSEKKYSLSPNELIICNKKRNTCEIESYADADLYSSWKDNMIVLKDTPLKEVINRLERMFNIDFIVEDEQVYNYCYTITTEKTSLDALLDNFEKISPLRFNFLNGKVFIDMKK